MRSFTTSLVTLFSITLAKAAIFPALDTPFNVEWTSEELVDHDRVDPFNSSHPRRLMISRFTPVQPQKCEKSCKLKYMTQLVAEDIDASFHSVLGSDWPGNVFNELELDLCCEDKGSKPAFPLVILGTGFMSSRMLYSVLAQHLSGMGYEVVVIDHTYEAPVVEFPDGTVIRGGRIDYNQTEQAVFGLGVRAADISFVIDIVGTGSRNKVILTGMSYGGAAVAEAMLHDDRIAGGINYDGAMLGSALDLGTDRPFLIFGSTGHNSTAVHLDPSWARFWDAVETKHSATWMKELNIAETVHYSFSDVSSIGDLTGLRRFKRLRQFAFGDITGTRLMKIVREYSADFFEFVLGHGKEGLLAGPSRKYPEVTFYRESKPAEL